ncbi:sigma-70 family RNA polymerase sigma factor [Hydrogenophaga sp. 5NK40-0174]|uniref:sigma-70 family RNA polymerase sigma factor n=1 Tax=Hydrogenophaga sp. 5NK40-0174 TaxID=3127649 RepID=UPI003340921E
MSGPADDELLHAYAKGDPSAFEQLYERHAGVLWRFVLRSVQEPGLAEELAQDVWIAVIEKAGQFESRSAFRTWLLSIAHHRIVDHWRRHRPHVSLDADADEGRGWAEKLVAESGFGPVRQLQSREQGQALLDALAALPIEQREAFVLQAEGGLSVADIASVTKVPHETAKSRLRYARAQLRKVLEDQR